MIPGEKVLFWRDALPTRSPPLSERSQDRLIGGDLLLLPLTYNYRGSAALRLGDEIRLDLLRFGNVGYVVSYIPLVDADLKQVSGPAPNRSVRRSLPFGDKLRADIQQLFDPNPVFVYRLERALPRAYLARALAVTRPDEDRAAFYERIANGVL